MTRHPSEIHQDLTPERINEIGEILAHARYENLMAADDRDDGWCLGCRAYSWCRSELIKASERIPYLTIKDPNLKFIARIGSVEISIYKGDSTKPKKNIYSRAQSFPELRNNSLFGSEEIPEKIVWSYAIETDIDGNTTNIEFFGMSEAGDIVASHAVPLNKLDNAVLTSINQNDPEPVDIPAAVVTLPSDAEGEAKDEHENNREISRR